MTWGRFIKGMLCPRVVQSGDILSVGRKIDSPAICSISIRFCVVHLGVVLVKFSRLSHVKDKEILNFRPLKSPSMSEIFIFNIVSLS